MDNIKILGHFLIFFFWKSDSILTLIMQKKIRPWAMPPLPLCLSRPCMEQWIFFYEWMCCYVHSFNASVPHYSPFSIISVLIEYPGSFLIHMIMCVILYYYYYIPLQSNVFKTKQKWWRLESACSPFRWKYMHAQRLELNALLTESDLDSLPTFL